MENGRKVNGLNQHTQQTNRCPTTRHLARLRDLFRDNEEYRELSMPNRGIVLYDRVISQLITHVRYELEQWVRNDCECCSLAKANWIEPNEELFSHYTVGLEEREGQNELLLGDINELQANLDRFEQ